MPAVNTQRVLVSALVIGLSGSFAASLAFAQGPAADAAKPKITIKPAAKPAAPSHPAAAPTGKTPSRATTNAARKGKPVAAVAPPVEVPLPPAPPEQIAAAEKIYYGMHDCEFKQSMDVSINPKYPAYVDVKFDKKTWVMKPVLSSTGALRLEDVKNTAVVIQIAQKSMLLNTVSGQRLVDECISGTQRELAAEAKRVAADGAAALAAAPKASEPK